MFMSDGLAIVRFVKLVDAYDDFGSPYGVYHEDADYRIEHFDYVEVSHGHQQIVFPSSQAPWMWDMFAFYGFQPSKDYAAYGKVSVRVIYRALSYPATTVFHEGRPVGLPF